MIRRVHMKGSIPKESVEDFKTFLDKRNGIFKNESYGTITGLIDWIKEDVDIIAHLDKGIDDMIKDWEEILKEFPCVNLAIHVGGEEDSDICTCTLVIKDGQILQTEPQIEKMPLYPQMNIAVNLVLATKKNPTAEDKLEAIENANGLFNSVKELMGVSFDEVANSIREMSLSGGF